MNHQNFPNKDCGGNLKDPTDRNPMLFSEKAFFLHLSTVIFASISNNNSIIKKQSNSFQTPSILESDKLLTIPNQNHSVPSKSSKKESVNQKSIVSIQKYKNSNPRNTIKKNRISKITFPQKDFIGGLMNFLKHIKVIQYENYCKENAFMFEIINKNKDLEQVFKLSFQIYFFRFFFMETRYSLCKSKNFSSKNIHTLVRICFNCMKTVLGHPCFKIDDYNERPFSNYPKYNSNIHKALKRTKTEFSKFEILKSRIETMGYREIPFVLKRKISDILNEFFEIETLIKMGFLDSISSNYTDNGFLRSNDQINTLDGLEIEDKNIQQSLNSQSDVLEFNGNMKHYESSLSGSWNTQSINIDSSYTQGICRSKSDISGLSQSVCRSTSDILGLTQSDCRSPSDISGKNQGLCTPTNHLSSQTQMIYKSPSDIQNDAFASRKTIDIFHPFLSKLNKENIYTLQEENKFSRIKRNKQDDMCSDFYFETGYQSSDSDISQIDVFNYEIIPKNSNQANILF